MSQIPTCNRRQLRSISLLYDEVLDLSRAYLPRVVILCWGRPLDEAHSCRERHAIRGVARLRVGARVPSRTIRSGRRGRPDWKMVPSFSGMVRGIE
jgi:hypothetical protein